MMRTLFHPMVIYTFGMALLGITWVLSLALREQVDIQVFQDLVVFLVNPDIVAQPAQPALVDFLAILVPQGTLVSELAATAVLAASLAILEALALLVSQATLDSLAFLDTVDIVALMAHPQQLTQLTAQLIAITI